MFLEFLFKKKGLIIQSYLKNVKEGRSLIFLFWHNKGKGVHYKNVNKSKRNFIFILAKKWADSL